MDYIIHNGVISKRDTVVIDIEDRGYQFGDGIYEVIRIYNGKLFTWKEHLNRLFESAEKIRLNIPYTMAELKAMLDELIKRNSVELGTVYLQFSRGVSPRNHAFPGKDVQPVFIANTKHSKRPEEIMDAGVDAWLVEDKRWLYCDIKSLNLLGNVLAYEQAHDKGCFEAIQQRGDIVTEGSHTNVFMIKDGVVKTHPANNLILNGITRQVILKICKKLQIPYEEIAFTTEHLLHADEVFISGTSLEITPVKKVNDQLIGNHLDYPIIRKLQSAFLDEIEQQCGV